MTNKNLIIGGIVGLVLILGLMLVGSYNGLVNSQSDVEAANSKIESSLQRRMDLIPNVVETVKGYMTHEQDIFTDIADARAKIGSNTYASDPAQEELDSAVSRLLVSVENYPELKADSQTSKLINELEGTENRIFVARNDYNIVATSYNKKIRRFPTNLFAGIFGFEKAELYKSQTGAEKAPTVNLGD